MIGISRYGIAAITMLACMGCGADGPALGIVEGKVTLDGAPLPNAQVMFAPPEGRTSVGIADDEGRYGLEYAAGRKGAILGKHTVTVTTAGTVQNDDGTDKAIPEKVPAKYNAQSELEFEVESGRNTIDLELDSDGALPQTDPDGEFKDSSAC